MLKSQKRKLERDLWLIFIISAWALCLAVIFNDNINTFARDTSVNIVLRVLGVGAVQYALAGLGITVVCIFRRESFRSFGLNMKKLPLTVLLSAACCLPDLIYNLAAGHAHAWMPFSDVNMTAEVLRSGFPFNVLGMLITAVCWGFFEGFNYVVICEKISRRLPVENKFFDWGALICAVMCILIHGAVGVTPDAVIEMLCTIFLIYGMLIVRKNTGNAWGCVLIFFFYWNAV